MRILGIDPGYGITGFGLIEAQRNNFALLRYGAITTPPGADFSARLEMIYEDMKQLLELAKPEQLKSCFSVRMSPPALALPRAAV